MFLVKWSGLLRKVVFCNTQLYNKKKGKKNKYSKNVLEYQGEHVNTSIFLDIQPSGHKIKLPHLKL